MTIKRDDDGAYIGVACDTCGKLAPSQALILAGHGLNQMNWWCYAGRHLCPICPHPERPVKVGR